LKVVDDGGFWREGWLVGFGECRGILAGEEGRERLIIVRYDNLMSEEVHVFGY
jgi:hypothetical protein